MARSTSGKVIAILDVTLKADLHAALAKEGLSFKEWLTERAESFVKEHLQPSPFRLNSVSRKG
jgi:hypothetical protein